jgi:YceI-like domain
VFRVDPARSLVVIEVRRGGSLAQFGHDHVVASHDTVGSIAPDQGRADLWVPLDALVVDEPALRAEAGFVTQPSPDDIASTRRNMLEKVLETDRHPYALIAVTDVGASGSAKQLRVAITLHGMTRSVDTAAQFEKTAEEVSVTGTIAIDQSQFGIAPFSVFGGAIAVQDRLNIAFRLRARRME